MLSLFKRELTNTGENKMVKKTIAICDRCDKHTPLGKCSICDDDLCWKCSNILIVDKGKTEVRFRFDKFSAEEEADKLIISKELSNTIKKKLNDTRVVIELFCDDCVKKVINNVNIGDDFMRIIREKIMVDSI